MTCLWDMTAPDDQLTPEWATLPEPTKTHARTLASRTLERLTGGRVGVCPVTVRPVRQTHRLGCARWATEGGYYPVMYAGTWRNRACGCGSQCELSLAAPIGRIDEVRVDGQVLDPSDYEVQDEHLLVWTGSGPCPFPASQDFSVPLTEPGTMSVTYVNAYLPGPEGEVAATILALEFAKALVPGTKTCRLPAGVTQVARQGITMTIPSGAFPEGRTGIREIDTFIALWNPHNIEPSQVWSPDLPSPRRVGG